MNPFRYLPKMFFAVVLFAIAPFAVDFLFPDDPAVGIDCAAPKTEQETLICKAETNLQEAQRQMMESAKRLKDYAR